MTVEVVEPGNSAVVEATAEPSPVLEIHTQDSAVVEVVEPGQTTAVEVVVESPDVVEVLSPEPAPSVEVIEQPATVIEVVSPGPDSGGGGGVVRWDAIYGKPSQFPPTEHTSDLITDFSTAVQHVLVEHGGGTQALQDHIDSPTPHPAYDNVTPSLRLLYENGLI